jgi:hypothetical protein
MSRIFLLALVAMVAAISPDKSAALTTEEVRSAHLCSLEKTAYDLVGYQMQQWIKRGQETIKKKLRDPESAQFRNMFFCFGKRNNPMTCGEVNSKNGFGGYSGFQPFVSGGFEETTVLSSDMKPEEFAMFWRIVCEP